MAILEELAQKEEYAEKVEKIMNGLKDINSSKEY